MTSKNLFKRTDEWNLRMQSSFSSACLNILQGRIFLLTRFEKLKWCVSLYYVILDLGSETSVYRLCFKNALL